MPALTSLHWHLLRTAGRRQNTFRPPLHELGRTRVNEFESLPATSPSGITGRAILYTVSVVNKPARIDADISILRKRLLLASPEMKQLERQQREREAEAVKRQDADREIYMSETNRWRRQVKSFEESQSKPTYADVIREGTILRDNVKDPTALIVVDETDQLKVPSIEQLRHIFDRGGIGLVLIGMPGLEQRLARYPQLYSRVGFAHEFRPLTHGETRQLLQDQQIRIDVPLREREWADEEGIASIVRISAGNFRLLGRLLTQIGRILEINNLHQVTRDVVETARENLVIGTD
jgi:DNA transposition AAA+ family ATPase